MAILPPPREATCAEMLLKRLVESGSSVGCERAEFCQDRAELGSRIADIENRLRSRHQINQAQFRRVHMLEQILHQERLQHAQVLRAVGVRSSSPHISSDCNSTANAEAPPTGDIIAQEPSWFLRRRSLERRLQQRVGAVSARRRIFQACALSDGALGGPPCVVPPVPIAAFAQTMLGANSNNVGAKENVTGAANNTSAFVESTAPAALASVTSPTSVLVAPGNATVDGGREGRVTSGFPSSVQGDSLARAATAALANAAVASPASPPVSCGRNDAPSLATEDVTTPQRPAPSVTSGTVVPPLSVASHASSVSGSAPVPVSRVSCFDRFTLANGGAVASTSGLSPRFAPPSRRTLSPSGGIGGHVSEATTA
eukprot:TRINITY_DN62337_c0_g1_i1.p1 TRINITY_DN62337_c0_g1~~TRINITY_DN62337_c0_g1_i1.p1  ORF type:complete len:402 (+),score=49.97 TRINITY_DN62337_c0_g1_i1:94-1206(+)